MIVFLNYRILYNYYQDPMTIMKGTTSDTSYHTFDLLRAEFLYVNIWLNLVQFLLYEFVNFLQGHFFGCSDFVREAVYEKK